MSINVSAYFCFLSLLDQLRKVRGQFQERDTDSKCVVGNIFVSGLLTVGFVFTNVFVLKDLDLVFNIFKKNVSSTLVSCIKGLKERKLSKELIDNSYICQGVRSCAFQRHTEE